MFSRRINLIESTVERSVCAFARSRGWLSRKLRWIGRVGAPDRYFTKAGHIPFMVEFKKKGKTPRKSQQKEIARLRDSGTIVYEIDNIEDGKALFED